MNDKEFDEIMHKYVASTQGTKEKDLSKLKNAEIEKNCTKEKTVRKKSVGMLLTAFLTVVLVLSITLPLILNNKDIHNAPIVYQITNADIDVDSDAGLNQLDEYDKLLLPSVDRIDTVTSVWRLKETDIVIGAEQTLDIFGELLESIHITLLKEEYNYNVLNNYYNFADSVEWKDITIAFKTESDLYGILYNTYISFEYGKYKYYLSVEAYDEIAISELLDMIY